MGVDDLAAVTGAHGPYLYRTTGTHTGELMGMPPTGKQMNISGMCMFRITEGRVTEWAEVFDQMTLMHQIGAIPTPARSNRLPPRSRANRTCTGARPGPRQAPRQ